MLRMAHIDLQLLNRHQASYPFSSIDTGVNPDTEAGVDAWCGKGFTAPCSKNPFYFRSHAMLMHYDWPYGDSHYLYVTCTTLHHRKTTFTTFCTCHP